MTERHAERTVYQSMPRRLLVTLPPTASVHEAACVMTRAGCGSVLVIDSGTHLLGIVTERDLMTRVLAKAADPAQTTLASVMTPNPRCIISGVRHLRPRLCPRPLRRLRTRLPGRLLVQRQGCLPLMQHPAHG